jgi:ectoine hydroxylase-related dioxygenase (phytanoyl-CoA dioxygenase family)
MPLSAADRRAVDQDSYLVLRALLPGKLLARARRRADALLAQEGDAAGAEFQQEPGCRRLANLVNKGDVFRAVIAHPLVLECARHVLGPDLKLSSLNARSADPGGGARPLHADRAALPDAKGSWACNTIRMSDASTPNNAAPGLVPGSRRLGQLPPQALADPQADHPEQVLGTGRAGTVVVPNAHAWHAGTANRTDRPRASLHAFYCRRDRPQQQYQKQLLRPEVQQSLPPELRELLALDDPLNDRLSAAAAVRSGFMRTAP